MRPHAILRNTVGVSFLGRIMMLLVSATIRAEERGSVGEAVVVVMGMGSNVVVRRWLWVRARKNGSQRMQANWHRDCHGARRRNGWRRSMVLGLRAARFLATGTVAI